MTHEPTDSELIGLIKGGIPERKGDLRRMVARLSEMRGGTSIFLDGEWGTGKTYFVRQAVLMLRAMNEKLAAYDLRVGKPKVTSDQLNAILGDAWRKRYRADFVPVYVNAWADDDLGEPMLSFAASLAKCFGLETKEGVKYLDLFLNSAVVLASAAGPLDFKRLFEPLQTEDWVQIIRDRDRLHEQIGKSIKQVVNDWDATKMVIFIDELDRCRPDYAVEVLEHVKHLLVRDDVIVVYATNAGELSHTIRRVYGDGFDADRYLNRFRDERFTLTDPNRLDLMSSRSINGGNRDEELVRELVDAVKLPLREIELLGAEFFEVRNWPAEHSDDFLRFVYHTLYPLVLYLRVADQRALRGLRNEGAVPEGACEIVANLACVVGPLGRWMAEDGLWAGKGIRPNPGSRDDRTAFLADIVALFLAPRGLGAEPTAAKRLAVDAEGLAAVRLQLEWVVDKRGAPD